jgi:hypothetical protein
VLLASKPKPKVLFANREVTILSKMTDSLESWLIAYPEGRAWLSAKLKSPETKRYWIEILHDYCQAVRKNPTELITLKFEVLTNPVKVHQAEKLMVNYLTTNAKLTPSTKVSAKNAIKSFYSANWFALEPAAGEDITQPEPKQRSPEMQDLLELEQSMVSKRDRAILWFLSSAPFRKGTLGKLVRKDLIPTGDNQVPYQIIVSSKDLKGKGEGKYSRLKQVCFLHWYAVEKLREYEQELKDKNIAVKDESPIFIEYGGRDPQRKLHKDRPLLDFERIFRRASFRAWHDLDVKRFSPQDMRDFVQSKLESAKVPANMIKPILAHKVKDVEYHYSNHQVDELRENFKSALPWLIPESLEQVKAETQKKLAEEQKRLVSLEYENTDLKGKMNNLNTRQETTEGQLALLKKYVFTVGGVVETKEDVEELQGFLEKMRKAKDEKNTIKPWEEE